MPHSVQLHHQLYTCSANRRLIVSAASLRTAGSPFDLIVASAPSMTSSETRPKLSEILPSGVIDAFCHHNRC